MPNWKKVVVSGSDAILNNITATGDVTVQGDLIAENYIISSSVTHVTQSFSSGSTIFGDTNDDTHQFTGSIQILHTGSTYGLEMSGSNFLIDYGDLGSVTLGEHNIGKEILGLAFPITGSGLIISQSFTNEATHHNMVKIGETELVDISGSLGGTEAFLLSVRDKILVVSSSLLDSPVAQIANGNHKLYAGTQEAFKVSPTGVSIAPVGTTIISSPATSLRVPTGIVGNCSYIIGQSSFPNATAAPIASFATDTIFSEFGGAITASAVSSSGLLFASLSEDTAGSYNNSVVYDTATGQFYYTGSYGGGGGGGNVSNTGTPVDNQVAVWTDATTIEGTTDFTYDGNILQIQNLIDFNIQADNHNLDGGVVNVNDEIYLDGINGNITASSNISASGNIFANTSDAGGASYNTLMVNTTTGKFFHTGSYGGGGGGGGATPGGSAGSIQYNDGSSGFDGEDKFKYEDTNNRLIIESVGTTDSIGLGFETGKPHLVGSTDSNFYLSERHGALRNFGVFDRLNRFLCLQPIASTTGNTHIPSARLHILDNPTNSGNPITKIINQNNKGTYNLLMGTAATANSLGTGQHKFISFYINSNNDGGNTPLNGAIYFDPSGGLGGGNPSINTVLFHGVFSSPSDKKLKKHITFTKKGIEDIMSFKVKDFRWKEDDKTTDKTTGLIAQDLIESHPYLVRELEGKLSVDYQGIIPLLIKAVQDQQEQINELKEQLKNK